MTYIFYTKKHKMYSMVNLILWILYFFFGFDTKKKINISSLSFYYNIKEVL